MIANAGENEQGEIEQWLTTGNDYYDVDAEEMKFFSTMSMTYSSKMEKL